MTTAVKSAFDRINKEYATTGATSARSGTQAPPVRPTGPGVNDPSPYGAPGTGYPNPGWGTPGPGANPYAPGGFTPGAPGSGAPGGWSTPDPYAPPRPGSGGPGSGWGGGGSGGGGGGWGGGGRGRGRWGQVPSASDAGTRPFSATRTYDKLATLVILALVAGLFGYFGAIPTGLAFVCIIAAFACSMVAWFKIRWSKVLAPAYAILEGLALGVISSAYATASRGIVPTAIVFTAAVFIGCLVSYRTGLVRVTPRMVSFAMIGAFGIMAVFFLSLLGLTLPGVNGVGPLAIIFALAILAIAVANLFTDFAFVTQSERLSVSSEAEWAAALAMMTALVLVYLSMLRLLAALYGGGRR